MICLSLLVIQHSLAIVMKGIDHACHVLRGKSVVRLDLYRRRTPALYGRGHQPRRGPRCAAGRAVRAALGSDGARGWVERSDRVPHPVGSLAVNRLPGAGDIDDAWLLASA